jgi:hypothetical protein
LDAGSTPAISTKVPETKSAKSCKILICRVLYFQEQRRKM